MGGFKDLEEIGDGLGDAQRADGLERGLMVGGKLSIYSTLETRITFPFDISIR